MLIMTAIISIEMKPESVAEFEFPTGFGRIASRNNRNNFDLEFSGEVGYYMIDYLL